MVAFLRKKDSKMAFFGCGVWRGRLRRADWRRDKKIFEINIAFA
jgi:hypothetical protein